jgi:hypothetical protein
MMITREWLTSRAAPEAIVVWFGDTKADHETTLRQARLYDIEFYKWFTHRIADEFRQQADSLIKALAEYIWSIR